MTVTTLTGIIMAVVMALSMIVGAALWIAEVAGKTHANKTSVEDLVKDIIQINERLKTLEDHKTNVAILGSQMSMVLQRIEELALDVKHLLHNNARNEGRSGNNEH